jgi:hypothetical protein
MAQPHKCALFLLGLLSEYSVKGNLKMSTLLFVLVIGAVIANGLLAGASLDQSIKQLPARHRIGVIAFSAYSRASDLGNGIAFYAILGISAALLCIAAAITAAAQGVNAPDLSTALNLSALLAVLHSLVTTQAAPTNFSQRKVADDEAALQRIFNRFERWQALRAGLQIINFLVSLWVLVLYLTLR